MAFRGLFIVDGKGVLRQITVNDLPIGLDVDETLRLIQAFQFTDENGKLKIEIRIKYHPHLGTRYTNMNSFDFLFRAVRYFSQPSLLYQF